MKKALLPALLLLLSMHSRALPYGNPQIKNGQAAPAGASATMQLSKPGSVVPKQQVPVPNHGGTTPHKPTKLPPPMPRHTLELPEDITLNSICLIDNIDGPAVMFQAESRGSTPQQLNYLDKTVVDVPPGTTIFSIWLKSKPTPQNKKLLLLRCPLSRGNSYQIFVKTVKHKQQLAVSQVLGG